MQGNQELQSRRRKKEETRQSEAQASLTAEVDRRKEEAETAKAAEAAKAAADAKAKEKAKADADAKAKAAANATADAKAKQTRCSDRVSAGANTSCAFALVVEESFYNSGGGNQDLYVYSPVTGLWYTMRCQAGVPSVCRGGNNNNAVVYIR